MPVEYSPTLFEFATIEGHQVVAAFDGGAITSDAGALLLGETDRQQSSRRRGLLPASPTHGRRNWWNTRLA